MIDRTAAIGRFATCRQATLSRRSPFSIPDIHGDRSQSSAKASLAVKKADQGTAIGVEPVVADSDDFIRAVQRDIRNFTRVAKEANIKAD
jgi:hypothetical protein